MTGFWDAMRDIAKAVAPLRPQIGQLAKVYRGKHKGMLGRIVWHGRDKYSDAFRYGNEASLHLRDMLGRSGFRVGIEPVSYDENAGQEIRSNKRIYTRAEYIITEAQ